MDILIISATEFELKEFKLHGIDKINSNIKIETLITGIGIPSTIFHLTKALSKKKYDYIIQTGIAGSFTKKLSMGEVVIVQQDTFAELGVFEKKEFKTIFESGLMDQNLFPFENSWLKNKSVILDSLKLKKVNGVTINTLSDSKKQFNRLKNKFEAMIESMEGAALHFVCIQFDQPFIQLRSISNKVGVRDKKKWDINLAITNLNRELLLLLNTISK